MKEFNRLPQGKNACTLLVYILSMFECVSREEIRSTPDNRNFLQVISFLAITIFTEMNLTWKHKLTMGQASDSLSLS